jgi:hypothetical protein
MDAGIHMRVLRMSCSPFSHIFLLTPVRDWYRFRGLCLHLFGMAVNTESPRPGPSYLQLLHEPYGKGKSARLVLPHVTHLSGLLVLNDNWAME